MSERADERLQKVLARAGIASRRQSEKMISEGRVKVNGQTVTEMGTRVDIGGDLIEIDGRPISRPEEKVYLLLNKPSGFITSLDDPRGRPKVVDLVKDLPYRLYPVGRLDMETEGLLLLTNDGDLCYRLSHPRFGVEKTYQANVLGVPSAQKLKTLEQGMVLEDGPTAPARVRVIGQEAGNGILLVTIHEGRKRQVRRMLETIGHPVMRLKRTQYGFLDLKGVKVGSYRRLTEEEVTRLHGLAAGEVKPLRHKTKKEAAVRRKGFD